MWIFLNNAFISVVAPAPGSPAEGEDKLVVRARTSGDLARVFGDDVIEQRSHGRDYAFRATVARKRVADAIAEQVRQIKYTNFKDSVEETDRHNAYVGVWHAMNSFQHARGHGGAYPPLR